MRKGCDAMLQGGLRYHNLDDVDGDEDPVDGVHGVGPPLRLLKALGGHEDDVEQDDGGHGVDEQASVCKLPHLPAQRSDQQTDQTLWRVHVQVTNCSRASACVQAHAQEQEQHQHNSISDKRDRDEREAQNVSLQKGHRTPTLYRKECVGVAVGACGLRLFIRSDMRSQFCWRSV
eukprot:1009804-Rhodomonas_salina.2